MGNKPDKVQRTENSSRLDPASQRYRNSTRNMGDMVSGGIMNGPYGMGGMGGGGGYGMAGPGAMMGGGPGMMGNPMMPGQSNFGPYGQNSFFAGPETRNPGQIAAPFMNAYEDQVVGGIQQNYDRQRGQAGMAADQQAIMNGAFGGSRHGVESAVRKGALDRQENQQIANVRASGYDNSMRTGLNFANQQRQLMDRRLQEGIFRGQTALGMRNNAFGPYGMDQTGKQIQPGGSRLGGIVGGGLAGFASGGPWGALAGAGLGAF